MLLIKNARIFTPTYLGKKDILIGGGKILQLSSDIRIPKSFEHVTIINAAKLIAVPGFIDGHVHIAGGGGEGGFHNRTPEIQLTRLTTAGITTVVGLLGTDGTTRSLPELLAKALGLEIEGISTYIYTGAYEVPTRTITGSIRSDIILIDKVIGVGEIALSDHRSSHPSEKELSRIVSEARVGGILSGKAGIVHVHIGDDNSKLSPLFELITNNEIPITQILPTHLNRNPYLLEDAVKFCKMGGIVDITSGIFPDSNDPSPIKPSKAIKYLIDQGIKPSQITMSSDGNGSSPLFDEYGHLTGIGIGSVKTLWQETRDLVVQEGFDLEQALAFITSNVAKTLALYQKGEIRRGMDADIVLLSQDMEIHTVICRGKLTVENKQPKIYGTFEKYGI